LDFLVRHFVDSDLMRRPASQSAVGVFDPARTCSLGAKRLRRNTSSCPRNGRRTTLDQRSLQFCEMQDYLFAAA
jgi:hypothetical protein